MFILSMGLNFKTAPVDIREKLSFIESEVEMAQITLQQEKSILENVIISTCNRTEIIAVVDQIHTARFYLKRFIADWFQMEISAVEHYLYFYEDGEAVKHLYEVAAGLDSLVLGETQILGQVKNAFDTAHQLGTTGTLLNQLFKMTITFAKSVHSQTKINENAVSVSYAAVEVAKKVHGDIAGKHFSILGAGEMSKLALQNIAGQKATDLTILNRTLSRAEVLAAKHGGKAAPIDELGAILTETDVFISSVSVAEPIISKADMEAWLATRPEKELLVIDIGVPRNIADECAEIPNLILYNIDDLEGVVSANTEERKRIVAKLGVVIEQEVAAFYEWQKQLGVVPIIRELRNNALQIQAETMRSLTQKIPGLTDREEKVIGKHMKSIINQLLKQPISELKEMSAEEDAAYKLDIAKRIFQVEATTEMSETEIEMGNKQ
ncbi:glutamyl-tRNA reductase [Listeria grayi]|uniref:glutamyl-tRNA reductase n=1 Tax=Listeria grayi TaxID=1641 RepID=UPI0016233356|nr:glutamyl-tRNA reductase [Listeria grayi]MBC1920759.1 glutamyl-tRNA reductase [Listeria grayi]